MVVVVVVVVVVAAAAAAVVVVVVEIFLTRCSISSSAMRCRNVVISKTDSAAALAGQWEHSLQRKVVICHRSQIKNDEFYGK